MTRMSDDSGDDPSDEPPRDEPEEMDDRPTDDGPSDERDTSSETIPDAGPEPEGSRNSWIDEYGVPDDEPTDGTDDETAAHDADGRPPEESKMTFGVGRRDASDVSNPFADISTREGDPFEEMDTPFEEMDTRGVDPDAVWQELASAESRGSVGDAQERTYADVSKHSFCEGCEHFTDPPEVRCTHEGTEIIEFLDMETVRVVDCPIVAERRELEDSE
ncbi:hypothetical protein BRC65_07980 [Halobacteriales archaeon QH_2_65_14]|nr:MAG: hypothetical protein BRC65_07980 [Halobacteriales archaeon QH_2_65_14]